MSKTLMTVFSGDGKTEYDRFICPDDYYNFPKYISLWSVSQNLGTVEREKVATGPLPQQIMYETVHGLKYCIVYEYITEIT